MDTDVHSIYTIGPLDIALDSATGYPFIDLFYNATQSHAAASVMTSVIIICETAAAIAVLAAASRQLWAFARNRGLPFSSFFAPVRIIWSNLLISSRFQDHLPYDIPLNSVLFSLVLTVIIALINIGSTEALGILLSMYNSALIASYMITIGSVLLHRLKGGRLPQSRYSLGKWGILINCIALIYITPIFVFSFFPATPKPTPDSMNWAIVMVGGISLLATVYYILSAQRTYSPPDDTVEDYIDRYDNMTVASSEREVSDGAYPERIPVESVATVKRD
jgi:amino acid transporter